MPLTWLLWGSRGWIGGKVKQYLLDAGETVVDAQSRADDEEAVATELDAVKPDRAMAFIGTTHGPGFNNIDYLQQPGTWKTNLQNNLHAPLVLALSCKARGVHFTYLGTGCIFKYDADKHKLGSGVGFSESDKPTFFGSNYSLVKGFTDRLMHLLDDSVLNARIRMPIDSEVHYRNLVTKLTKMPKLVNIPNSMSVLPTLLPVLIDMAKKKRTGTVNLTNPGAISHSEIMDLYEKHVDPSHHSEYFSEEEQNRILLAERSNNFLDTYSLQEEYPDVPEIHKAVETAMVQMAQHDRNCK